MNNDLNKSLTLQEIFQKLTANGWTIPAISKKTGIKSAAIYRIKDNFYQTTSYQRYFKLVDLLIEKPPVKPPYNTAQYRKGFADGVASVKEKL
jgi:hypothetical protein